MVHFIVLKLCAHAEREIVKILHIVFALRNCYFYDLVCVPSGSGVSGGMVDSSKNIMILEMNK